MAGAVGPAFLDAEGVQDVRVMADREGDDEIGYDD